MFPGYLVRYLVSKLVTYVGKQVIVIILLGVFRPLKDYVGSCLPSCLAS
jgi:hypothetical protein